MANDMRQGFMAFD